VEEYYPHVIRIIRSHLPARTAEEDVAQEVFMKMFSRLEQFRGDQPFAHWLARIATNCCIDLLRKQRVRPEVRFSDLSPEEEAFLTACHQSEPESGPPPSSQDGTELVEKLLGSLKPDQQLVVRLLDVEQQSVKEICNQTGWTASKVKVTAMRARRKLAEVLKFLNISRNS
jgi:RNA polymerase sigma-70 factor (ECF subfamily)